MTAVFRKEMSTLSFLFRGLCLRNIQIDAICITQRAISGGSVPQKRETITTYRVLAAVPSPNLHRSVVYNGTQVSMFWQKRSYAKTYSTPRKPLSFDYSGDLMTQKRLNPEDIQADFRDLPQIKDAPEEVKKLCTIDFASGEERKIHRKEEMRERILQLFGPAADREMHVALLTVDIRNMIQHCFADKKDKLSKSRLVEKIQLRKKMLKYLRRTDYQRFLWLLQELQIRYVLPPEYYRPVTKRFRRKQRVWEEANNLRLKKIADLKQQLEAEKAEFLKYKEETLKQIEADAAKYDLDLEEFVKKLERKPVGKTYPRIYTWEERQQMEKEAAMK